MEMDRIDRELLDRLQRNGRASVRELARAVGLSPAPVSRRIARLEEAGVIRGYVAVVDNSSSGALEAFTEVRLSGAMETDEFGHLISQMPEVQEYSTIAGDPDLLVRLRVRDVDHLQQVVNAMRRTGHLTGTKTLIVMKSWSRATQRA